MSAHLPPRPSARRPLPAPTAFATRTALAGAAAALALTLAACGSPAAKSGAGDGHSGHSHAGATSTTAGGAHAGHDMPGMTATTGGPAGGAGLASEQNGYRLTSGSDTLPAGVPAEFRFTVTGPDGAPVTAFAVEQTKRLHFYAVRADLTGFQHLHPEMAADGGWTAPLDALAPGDWRLYASFTPDSGPGKGTALVLSRTVKVPGTAGPAPTAAATGPASVDGYTVTVDGAPAAGAAAELRVTVTKDGAPVTDLQPYLESYAHLTAFHTGDLAFAHLHPEGRAEGATGGPTLPFHAELPAAGDWRLFLQFRTAGVLHTAVVTLRVAG
ncbi:hypothetical protein GCM10010495_07870 [Kitasatospora herbaricolor]|uniref:hypothetical protein n=1 Tax=Kitasatospora herbaricolor TaxID=68217 RepID=UPI00199FC924|nr:hypothetical protein [Kitasatospora herbaricolor]MDQ0309775.1 hypothetical protein [Kitasatospora herbaricolor]GGU99677.1 hypothetical protein GCM10010495_07870 [Kitasatospora herbaricolor]